MKTIIFTLVTLFLFASCQQGQKTSQVSTGTQDTLAGNYGAEISADNAVPAAKVASLFQNSDSIPVKFEGEITATCAMKGCWMTVALPDSSEMRVTFKDYGFFVPKEGVEGRKAIAEGYAYRSVTDVETLRHFAQDAGKSEEEINEITEPKEEIKFVASGVIIE